jgi:hypothetical protein
MSQALRKAEVDTASAAIWAIGMAEPNCDFEVDLRLRKAGYRVVFLTYRQMLTGHNRPGWRKATDFISRPLFSGYLFLQLWPGEQWPRIERIPGYAGLLDNGRRSIAEATLMMWRSRVDAGEFDDRLRPVATIDRGKFQSATDPEERRRILAAHFHAALEQNDQEFA